MTERQVHIKSKTEWKIKRDKQAKIRERVVRLKERESDKEVNRGRVH